MLYRRLEFSRLWSATQLFFFIINATLPTQRMHKEIHIALRKDFANTKLFGNAEEQSDICCLPTN